MKDFEKKLADFKGSNPISLFYEFGMTPEDIKSAIIDSFSSYFKNVSNLQQYSISDLVGTWLSYLTLCNDYPDLIKYIELILQIFNGAKQADQERAIATYLKWFPELTQSISRFWSLYNNQTNIVHLCIEDFLEEALRVIGQSIEGLSKPFLKLLLHLNRIKRKKAVDFADIHSKDLGIVIDELISTGNLADLLILNPNNVRLNQWRNIAYHHNSKAVGGKLFCAIMRNGLLEEFEISKPDLFGILKRILAIFKLIRISETIFFVDNNQQIQLQLSVINESEINIREESKLLDFYSSLTSQGFNVIDLKYDNGLQD